MPLDDISPGKRGRFVPPDRKVAEIAARQHGVIARGQLLALGLGSTSVERRIRAGHLHPVHFGAYAVGHRRLTQHGIWMAAVLACGDGALLSHRSAAAHWGIEEERGLVHVTVRHRGTHGRPGIAIHQTRRLEDDERELRHGIPVTSVARTLLDLAGVLNLKRLRRALEEADRLGILDLAALNALLLRTTGRRGAGRLRDLLAAHRGPETISRSELERLFLGLCRDAGIPRPAVNVDVLGYEVDCLWPDAKLVLELDSWGFHRGRAAFENDRRRDAALQRAGYRVLRITYRRLVDESEAVIADLRALLPRAG
jgi:hypothetical protein